MKNLLFILFFSIPFLSNAQHHHSFESFKVIYNKALKQPSDHSDKPPKVIAGIEYELIANKNESRFEFIEGLMMDAHKGNERFITLGGGSGVYYKNIEQEELIRKYENGGKDYLISIDYQKYDWELIRETKEILGFTCYKALGSYTQYHNFAQKDITYEITVWYTPEIPLPFGPGEFIGVPGLVLEAVSGSFYMIAEEIEFFKKSKSIKKPQKGIAITEDGFNELLYEQHAQKVGQPIKVDLPEETDRK